MAEVDVGRGRVDPELHPQRTALAAASASLRLEPAGGQAVDGVARERSGLRGSVEAGSAIRGQC